LIRPINDLAAFQVCPLELGTKVLVFSIEQRAKDVISDTGVCSSTLTLVRFHFSRTYITY
jgi:hypothetical protein